MTMHLGARLALLSLPALGLLLAGCPPEGTERPEVVTPQLQLGAELVPSHGPETGATRVRVPGQAIHPLATLAFGDRMAADVEVAGDGSWIQGLTPPGVGVVDVLVVAPGGQRGLLSGAYRYDRGPAVESLSPAFGPRQGGTPVVLQGSDFDPAIVVTLGGVAVRELERQDAEHLAFVTPPGRGLADLRVLNPDGQSATLSGAFDFLDAPRVVSVDPDSGSGAGGTRVSVAGSGFREGLEAWLGEAAVTDLSVDSSARLTFLSPAGEGLVALRLRNPDGQEALLEDAFRYVGLPVVEAVEPALGPEAGGTEVLVTGTGFDPEFTRVFFGTAALRDAVYDAEAGGFRGRSPQGRGLSAVHAETLAVRGPDLAEGFLFVAPPRPERVEPAAGPAAGGYWLDLFGVGLAEGARILLGGVEAPEVEFVTDAHLRFRAPSGTPGLAELRIVNPDLQAGRLADAFRYVPAPALDSVEPQEGCVSGGSLVTLTGRNLDPTARVFFGEVEAEVQERGGGRIVVLSPPGDGPTDLVVRNADGQEATLVEGFDYVRRPLVDRVRGSHGPLLGGVEVEIEGGCFLEDITVRFGAAEADNVVVVSPSLLQVTTPPQASEGVVDVAVSAPDGAVGVASDAYVYHDAVFSLEVEELAVRSARGGLVADLDRDGDEDLLVFGAFGAQIWAGAADGEIDGPGAAFSSGGRSLLALAPIDLHGDGRQALVVVVEGEPGLSGGLYLLPQLAGLHWSALDASTELFEGPLFSVTVADLDGDGLEDVLAGGVGGAELFLNAGDGALQRVEDWVGRRTGGVVLSALAGDLTGDGRTDLFLAVRGDANRLLRGTGGGAFLDESAQRLPLTATATQAVVALDLDHDGDSDLVLGEQGRDQVWINEEGSFVDRSDALLPGLDEETVALEVADLDGDGWDDLLVALAPGAARPQRVLRNLAGLSFEDRSAAWLPLQTRNSGVAVLPLPGLFGLPDLLLLSASEGLRVRDPIAP